MNESTKGDVHDKIGELVAELEMCRADERNTQNQILQIILIAGTVLGILLGASYINSDKGNDINLPFIGGSVNTPYPVINETINSLIRNITPIRVMFWLSLLVFVIAYLYVLNLGIENLLRYHYTQNIGDRLQDLFSDTVDNNSRGKFLHWNEYSIPVRTKNVKHITSTHTALSFVTYIGAIVGLVMFSMGFIIPLFLMIDPIKWYDRLLLLFLFGLMFTTFFLFIRSSRMGRLVQQYAWDTAHKNQKIRMGIAEEENDKETKEFSRLARYFVYPRLKDIQKPLLIVVGFIFGAICYGSNDNTGNILLLVYTILFFDVLACQARFQINDIRGIKEDEEADKRRSKTEYQDRLISEKTKDKGRLIRISIKIALAKILLAVTMVAIYDGSAQKWFILCLVILLINTFMYEFARYKKKTGWIFFLVGAGYPLRVFVGVIAFSAVDMKTLISLPIFCFMAALWMFGSFSSILAWTNEITDCAPRTWDSVEQINGERGVFNGTFEKEHYTFLWKVIEERFRTAEKHARNERNEGKEGKEGKERILPLREKGSICDPWNITFALAMCFLAMSALSMKLSAGFIVIELLGLLSFLLIFYLSGRNKIVAFGCGLGFVLLKFVWRLLKFAKPAGYFVIALTQILVACTYFLLSYRPQLEYDWKACESISKFLFGENAVEEMKGKKETQDGEIVHNE